MNVITVAKTNTPNDMIEVKDRSISPVTTTSVIGKATMAKKGVVDINAR